MFKDKKAYDLNVRFYVGTAAPDLGTASCMI